MRPIVFFVLTAILFWACKGSHRQEKECGPANHLKTLLESLPGQYTLLGQQEALAYGVGWNQQYNQSDIRRCTGSHPALFGWDLGNIGSPNNIDGIPFDSIRSYIQQVHQSGGINTISWHARNPISGASSWEQNDSLVSSLIPGGPCQKAFEEKLDLVADFLNSLTNNDGQKIPIIFRPWHEMNGNWFWWGASHCQPSEFISLFRHTILYLKNKKGVDQLLVAYSPDRMFDTAEAYLKWYPGDDVIDILGMDNYYDFTTNRLDLVVKRLGIVAELARSKNKIAAFTETGCDKLTIDNWYTKNLLYVLNANENTRQMAYVMLWRNADTSHFYVPYPGHPQIKDFITFVGEKQILLLDEFNQIKTE